MEFRERLGIGLYSLLHGAALTLLAGWIGVLAFPEFLIVLPALPFLIFTAIAALTVSFSFKALTAFLTALFAPSIFAFISGSWLVTLVALPLLAFGLAPWPSLIARTAPVVGMASGGLAAASTLPPKLFSATSMAATELAFGPERMAIAGAFAGLIVGAIFGQAVARYVRD
jgi:hypothetical protein